MPSQVRYRTRSTFLSPLMVVVFALITLGTIGAIVYVLVAEGLTLGQWMLFSVFLVLFTAILGGCLVSHHRIEIGDDDVRLIWFPLYVKTIPADQLRSIGTETVNPGRTGLGLRLLGGGTLGLINRGGPALSIRTESGAHYLIVVPVEEDRAEAMRRLRSLIDAHMPR